MVRSKAYLFSGVEIRWNCDPRASPTATTRRRRRPSTSPAGWPTTWPSGWTGRSDLCRPALRRQGRLRRAIRRRHRSARSNGRSTGRRARRLRLSPTATPSRRRRAAPTRPGFWAAILKGIRAYGELVKNRKAAQITREDVMAGGCAMISVLHPRAGVRRPDQGPARDRRRRRGWSRARCATISTTGWRRTRNRPGAILDYLVLRPRNGCAGAPEKETQRKTAIKKLRLPGKLVDCSAPTRDGTELFLVEGDSAGGSRQAGARPQDPGGAAAARQDPQRARCGQRQDGGEPGDQRPLPGDGRAAPARGSTSTTCATTRSSS